MEKVRINEEKISPVKILLNIFWNSDEDIEKEWENEPKKKVLEEAIASVDKKEPKILPSSFGKKKSTRKLAELEKNKVQTSKTKNKKINDKIKTVQDKERD